MLNDRRVLVCGARGFIGSAVMRELGQTGCELYITNHADFDLTTESGWHRALLGAEPEIVFMCAGVTGGVGLDPFLLVTDNVIMHALMFRACAALGVKRIVLMSSSTGYPDLGPLPLAEHNYFDDEVFQGYKHAGETRRFIERMAEMYADKIEIVRLRVSNAYGPGDNFDPQTSHVIAASVRKVAERQDPITIWGDGSNRRDAVYIDDLARGIVMAADWPAGAYNFASGEEMSVKEILAELMNAAGYLPVLKFDLTKPTQLQRRILDCAKVYALGWKPTVPMRDGLVQTYGWFCKYG